MAEIGDGVAPDARTLHDILTSLGVFGRALLAWTVVTCCVFLGGDSRVVAQVWSDVFLVWVGLASAHVLVALVTGGVGYLRRVKRRRLGVEVIDAEFEVRDAAQ